MGELEELAAKGGDRCFGRYGHCCNYCIQVVGIIFMSSESHRCLFGLFLTSVKGIDVVGGGGKGGSGVRAVQLTKQNITWLSQRIP